jgi:hypothetical protein
MFPPQTMTSSRPFSSATPLSPAGDISREEPIAKRAPAMTNVCPACTRARKSGMRWRNEPAFQRSSSVSRLSDTQSGAGVIWSVSMASSFLPGRFGSQKMSACPRRIRPSPPAPTAPALQASTASRVTPGLRRAGSTGDGIGGSSGFGIGLGLGREGRPGTAAGQ